MKFKVGLSHGFDEPSRLKKEGEMVMRDKYVSVDGALLFCLASFILGASLASLFF